jgi:hypothetical protein
LVEVLEVLGGSGALEGLEEVVVDFNVVREVVCDVVWVFFEGACICLHRLLELVLALNGSRKLALKKYRSRPKAVVGGLLSFMDICPIMTMTIHMRPASVNSIGVRIHAKRPTLPIFAVVARLLLWWLVGRVGLLKRAMRL